MRGRPASGVLGQENRHHLEENVVTENLMPPQGQQPPPYPGTQQPAALAKPKKPWFKKWWVWVLAVVVLIGVGNALGNGGSTTAAPPPEVTVGTSAPVPEASDTPAEPPASEEAEPLTLQKGWKIDKSDGFAVYVTGYVKNNTDQAITNYVQITFDALDGEGANLTTCMDNTNTIDANGKWKFKAMCLGEAKEIDKVRFKEITGF